MSNEVRSTGRRVTSLFLLAGMLLSVCPSRSLGRVILVPQDEPTIQSGVDAADMLGWPMTITPSRAYCRPENGDQLLAGWAHTTQSEPEFDWADQDRIEPPFFHKSGLDNYGFRLWMELAEAMPAIGEFSGIEATTAGFYAVTPDHNPILGFDPQQPGLLHAAGFSGHGAMLGPFTAAAIAQMALAGRTLRTVMLDDEEVDLTDLLIGRDYSHAEGMVI